MDPTRAAATLFELPPKKTRGHTDRAQRQLINCHGMITL
jgi:hypothetical protein